MPRKSYKTVGLGGTFDHFHAGHETFISCASKLADNLIIGVTTQELTLGKPFASQIEPYDLRQRNVLNFCRKIGVNCKIVALNDIFGPTLEKGPIQALAVTEETQKGADLINQTRQQLQLRALPVYICEYFLAQDAQPLHAFQIRAGKADRRGLIYSLLFTNDITLTPSQREFFSQPLGNIVTEPSPSHDLICVIGDTCLENFIQSKWNYDLGVFDLRRQRADHVAGPLSALQAQTVANPAGTITRELVAALDQALGTQQAHLKVSGEEDLAAVALFLMLPLGSVVYYGQANQGMVEVHITESFKERVATALSVK